jgi:tRNA(fMet)-specific endonuclease VapC
VDVKGAARDTTLYLLDTNTVAYMVSGRSQAARIAMSEQIGHSVIAISAITEAEVLYGLAKKPEATRLRAAVEALFATVRILPWDSGAARPMERYGPECRRRARACQTWICSSRHMQ